MFFKAIVFYILFFSGISGAKSISESESNRDDLDGIKCYFEIHGNSWDYWALNQDNSYFYPAGSWVKDPTVGNWKYYTLTSRTDIRNACKKAALYKGKSGSKLVDILAYGGSNYYPIEVRGRELDVSPPVSLSVDSTTSYVRCYFGTSYEWALKDDDSYFQLEGRFHTDARTNVKKFLTGNTRDLLLKNCQNSKDYNEPTETLSGIYADGPYAIVADSGEIKFPFSGNKLGAKYQGEDKNCRWASACKKIKYLTPNELDQYYVRVVDGLLVDSKDKLLDSSDASGGSFSGEELTIFVMDLDGNIYATNDHPVFHFHHSSFLAGQQVAAAGELKITNGVLEFITDCSGHYRPAFEALNQVKLSLEHHGYTKDIKLNRRCGRR